MGTSGQHSEGAAGGTPRSAAGEGGWVPFEVLTASGQAVEIGLRIRLSDVDCWRGDRCCGVFDRVELRHWLDQMPRVPLSAGEVVLSVDRFVDQRGRVAITLPDVRAWTLNPATLAVLQDLI
jgi:hypothetical protein